MSLGSLDNENVLYSTLAGYGLRVCRPNSNCVQDLFPPLIIPLFVPDGSGMVFARGFMRCEKRTRYTAWQDHKTASFHRTIWS